MDSASQDPDEKKPLLEDDERKLSENKDVQSRKSMSKRRSMKRRMSLRRGSTTRTFAVPEERTTLMRMGSTLMGVEDKARKGGKKRSSILSKSGRNFSIAAVSGMFSKQDNGPKKPNKITRQSILEELLEEGESHYAFMDHDEVAKEFNSDIQNGLSSEDAKAILEIHGPNKLAVEPPEPFWHIFLAQFADLLVIVLVGACIGAFVLKQMAAGACISFILVFNALLGAGMEYKAGVSMRALLQEAPPQVKVMRDGQVTEINREELVPGDICVLEAGEIVPADIRLVEAHKLSCNESTLTGEPNPVKKNHLKSDLDEDDDDDENLLHPNMVYMGCEINSGSGLGLVLFTGMKTHMGQVAVLFEFTEHEPSPLEQKLQKLGAQLGIVSLLISLTIFFVGVQFNRGSDPGKVKQPKVLQLLFVSVSLTVAAVPEALPACVTISLAVGMKKMALQDAVVKKMKSVETLGSATVVCTDKTGTLTSGIMTMKRIWTPTNWETLQVTGIGYDPNGSFLPLDIADTKENEEQYGKKDGAFSATLLNAVLCCDDKTRLQMDDGKWVCLGQMSERPIIVACAKHNLKREEVQRRFKILKTVPFDSNRKRMSTVVKVKNDAANKNAFFGDSEYIICAKGSPDVVLGRCIKMLIIGDNGNMEEKKLTDDDRQKIESKISDLSEQSYRVLSIAYRPADEKSISLTEDEIEKDLILTGLIGIIDPARPGIPDAIEDAMSAGVRTIMITGDYLKTAKSIAMDVTLLAEDSPPEESRHCSSIHNLGRIEQRLIEIDSARQKEKQLFDLNLPNLNLPIASLFTTEKYPNLNAKEKEELEKAQVAIDEVTSVTNVFACAKPIDKVTILRSLFRQGEIPSMTGDGVNDGPALKQAALGVAMGSGTDVAKGASEIILQDDNFCTIIIAIKEGRTIYENIRKFTYYLLSTNVSEVIAVMLLIMIGYPSPLAPSQILWLNLATDVFPAVALALEPPPSDVMNFPPRPVKENLIDKVMLTELWRAHTCRSLRRSVFEIGFFKNPWVHLSVVLGMACTVGICTINPAPRIFGTVRLTHYEWTFCMLISLVPAALDELTKLIYRSTGFVGKRVVKKVRKVRKKRKVKKQLKKERKRESLRGDQKTDEGDEKTDEGDEKTYEGGEMKNEE